MICWVAKESHLVFYFRLYIAPCYKKWSILLFLIPLQQIPNVLALQAKFLCRSATYIGSSASPYP